MTGTSLVDQGMAARLGSGSVAALSYGTRLLGVLIVIGPTAVGTAVLPHISVGAMLADPRVLRRTLRTYGVAILARDLPVTAGAHVFFRADHSSSVSKGRIQRSRHASGVGAYRERRCCNFRSRYFWRSKSD